MSFSGKLVLVLVLCLRSLLVSSNATMSVTMKMNPATVEANDYYCTAATLPAQTSYIVGFRPEVDASIAHHVLLFGCSGSYDASSHSSSEWRCKSPSSVCGPDSEFTMLYAWALDAEGFKMPEGVGLKVGSGSNVEYVVLQIHFLTPPSNEDDAPTLVLDVTMDPQPYVAGIFLLGAHAGEGLPPGEPSLAVEVACEFPDSCVIYPFAYRTHAHSLGTVISGYVIKTERDAKVYHLIGQKSPQAPQAFYPVEEEGLSIAKGDWLAAACFYNTTNEPGTTWFGPNSNNEMCNFYIMYYKENDNSSLSTDECWLTPPDWVEFPASASNVPALSSAEPHSNVHPEDDMNVHSSPENEDTPTSWSKNNGTDIPTSSLMEDILNDLENGVGNGPDQSPNPPPAKTQPPDQVTSAPPDKTTSSTMGWQSTSQQSTLVLDKGWALNGLSGDETKAVLGVALGQVSAVSVDTQGNVHVLHRGSHVWDEFSFDAYNVYQKVDEGPISEPVVLKLSPAGTLLNSWGQDFFYLPHGLTVDSDGTYWITDVARHQVIKANPEETTVLTLGKEFQPGHGQYSFCKPAAMAVDKQAQMFYVADGYCNHRVVQYSMKGNYLHEFSAPVAGLNLFVPHSLALSSDGKQLFVADRENARIVRYDTSTGTGTVFSDSKLLGIAVYALSFASTGSMADTWPMCAINGSMYGEKQARGFTMDESGIIKDIWGPLNGFTQPHDVAMSSSAVYVAEIQPNRIWKFIVVAKETPPTSTSSPTNDEATTPSTSHSDTPHTKDNNSPPPATQPPTHQESAPPPLPENEEADDDVVSADAEEKKHVNVLGIVLPLILLGLPIIVTLIIVGWCYVSRRYLAMQRSIRRRQKNPRKTLDQLLQPAHSGFTRIKTYDSDSEDNADVTIFQKTQNSYAIST